MLHKLYEYIMAMSYEQWLQFMGSTLFSAIYVVCIVLYFKFLIATIIENRKWKEEMGEGNNV
jgi:hypothetical protein